jgi:hypothetical protein
LIVANSNALGATDKTTIAGGAALELSGDITIADNIVMGGSYNSLNRGGFAPAAAIDTSNGYSSVGGNIGNLHGLSGTNTISGNITLSGGTFAGDAVNSPGNNIGNLGLNEIGVSPNSTLIVRLSPRCTTLPVSTARTPSSFPIANGSVTLPL